MSNTNSFRSFSSKASELYRHEKTIWYQNRRGDEEDMRLEWNM